MSLMHPRISSIDPPVWRPNGHNLSEPLHIMWKRKWGHKLKENITALVQICLYLPMDIAVVLLWYLQEVCIIIRIDCNCYDLKVQNSGQLRRIQFMQYLHIGQIMNKFLKFIRWETNFIQQHMVMCRSSRTLHSNIQVNIIWWYKHNTKLQWIGTKQNK